MGEKGLTVCVSRGAIVIRLPLSVLAVALHAAPFNDRPDGSGPAYRVTDTAAFADALVAQLDGEEEDGTTPLHVMFDAAMQAAIDDGCEGVEEESVSWSADAPSPRPDGDGE